MGNVKKKNMLSDNSVHGLNGLQKSKIFKGEEAIKQDVWAREGWRVEWWRTLTSQGELGPTDRLGGASRAQYTEDSGPQITGIFIT